MSTKKLNDLAFSDRIKMLRHHLQMTQKEFAETLSRTYISVQNWEYGKVVPDESTLLLISNCFCISLEWLKTGNGTMLDKELTAQSTNIVDYDVLLSVVKGVENFLSKNGFTAQPEKKAHLISQLYMTYMKKMNKNSNEQSNIIYQNIEKNIDGDIFKLLN